LGEDAPEKQEKSQHGKQEYGLEYDPEWLAILKNTHHWNSTYRGPVLIPPPPPMSSKVPCYDAAWVTERLREFHAAETRKNREVGTGKNSESEANCEKGNQHLEIPRTFVPTVPYYTDPAYGGNGGQHCPPLPFMGNPQTDRLLKILELDHILTRPYDVELTPDRISALLQGKPMCLQATATQGNNNGSEVLDENEIDIDGGGDDDDEGSKSGGKSDNSDGNLAAAGDDNKIDINMDDSDDIDGDDGDDNKTTNNVCKDSFDAAAAPTTTTDTNEIDIDIDDESEEDTEVKAVAKKARLED